MSRSLHPEELNLLLDSPSCLVCDHREVLHYEGDMGTWAARCRVCHCAGYVPEGAYDYAYPEVWGWIQAT